MATKKTSGGGAPPWTYALGAIVGAATLVWAIVSYFLPKPPQPGPTASTPEVRVTAPGAVGVGTMSNSTVTVGAPAAPTAPPSPKP